MPTIPMDVLNAGLAVISYALLFVLYRLLRRRIALLQRSPIAIHLLMVLFPLNLFLSSMLGRLHARVPLMLLAAFLFMCVHLAVRLADVWLFDFVIARRQTVNIPVVLRDICRWLLSAVALLVIIRSLFPEVNLNVLAVSSIVVGYILGNATQDTLGNLVSGLALNTESPFTIGDWVTIAGNTGRIVDMTWRATSLRTKDGDYITIPNAAIARETITNFSQPTTVHGVHLEVGVNYGVAPAKAREALMEAVASVDEILRAPVPRVRLVCYNDFSIDYKIRVFINDFEQQEDICSKLMERIWYSFKRHGIVIPFPIRDINMRQITEDDDRAEAAAAQARKASLLDDIDLFSPLSQDDRCQLAETLSERIYGDGEVIVKQGSAGTLFFIIVSGEVDVSIQQAGRRSRVATLSAGDVFGEMSFLTGERTNATISAKGDCTVLTLSHTELKDVLSVNTELADELAAVLAKRQENADRTLATTMAGPSTQQGSEGTASAESTRALGQRIRRFFGLKSA
jgi:small-conductance mechanosensitive channel/CRP-like cAMP-binding protein